MKGLLNRLQSGKPSTLKTLLATVALAFVLSACDNTADTPGEVTAKMEEAIKDANKEIPELLAGGNDVLLALMNQTMKRAYTQYISKIGEDNNQPVGDIEVVNLPEEPQTQMYVESTTLFINLAAFSGVIQEFQRAYPDNWKELLQGQMQRVVLHEFCHLTESEPLVFDNGEGDMSLPYFDGKRILRFDGGNIDIHNLAKTPYQHYSAIAEGAVEAIIMDGDHQSRAMTPMYHAYAAPFMVLLDGDKVTTDDLIALVAHNNPVPLTAAMLNKTEDSVTEEDIVEFINWYYAIFQQMQYGLNARIHGFDDAISWAIAIQYGLDPLTIYSIAEGAIPSAGWLPQ